LRTFFGKALLTHYPPLAHFFMTRLFLCMLAAGFIVLVSALAVFAFSL
jgi:hypothetical protein